MSNSIARFVRAAAAVTLVLIGLGLAGGGVWLILLGGSLYYLIAGAAVAAIR